MKIYELTKDFPKEERYGLTDNLRRAARSIPVNIVEGWAKRKYENVFKRHLIDSIGSCEETKVWLEFSKDCGYLETVDYERLINEYNRLGAMLASLLENWETF